MVLLHVDPILRGLKPDNLEDIDYKFKLHVDPILRGLKRTYGDVIKNTKITCRPDFKGIETLDRRT